jgi:CheY-like chemotaxis protein
LRDEHGTMTGVVWLGREMTEERSRREREVRGEKLRALGQMASGVAHDLNQYLGLVAGYGDLTARSLDGPSPNLAAAREALEVVVHAETEAVTSLRVLVVDDEPTITRMVAMMLGPHGHDITIATSAEEALDRIAAAAEPFDLILSDLGLGDGMNGWDLLDRVRACTPGTRFILSTGWGAQIDPADIVARGGEGLLAKPYRLSDLLDAIAGPRG